MFSHLFLWFELKDWILFKQYISHWLFNLNIFSSSLLRDMFFQKFPKLCDLLFFTKRVMAFEIFSFCKFGYRSYLLLLIFLFFSSTCDNSFGLYLGFRFWLGFNGSFIFQVGAPPEIATVLEEIRQQNDFRKPNATSICIGADPELDEFMVSS